MSLTLTDASVTVFRQDTRCIRFTNDIYTFGYFFKNEDICLTGHVAHLPNHHFGCFQIAREKVSYHLFDFLYSTNGKLLVWGQWFGILRVPF